MDYLQVVVELGYAVWDNRIKVEVKVHLMKKMISKRRAETQV